MTEPHGVTVSHVPLDGPGVRISRPGEQREIRDVGMGELHELRQRVEEGLEQTAPFLDNAEMRPLVEATRAALIGLDTIAIHLAQLHAAIEAGRINYATPVWEDFTRP